MTSWIQIKRKLERNAAARLMWAYSFKKIHFWYFMVQSVLQVLYLWDYIGNKLNVNQKNRFRISAHISLFVIFFYHSLYRIRVVGSSLWGEVEIGRKWRRSQKCVGIEMSRKELMVSFFLTSAYAYDDNFEMFPTLLRRFGFRHKWKLAALTCSESLHRVAMKIMVTSWTWLNVS